MRSPKRRRTSQSPTAPKNNDTMYIPQPKTWASIEIHHSVNLPCCAESKLRTVNTEGMSNPHPRISNFRSRGRRLHHDACGCFLREDARDREPRLDDDFLRDVDPLREREDVVRLVMIGG